MGLTDRKGPYRWEREIARTLLVLIAIAVAAPLPYFIDVLFHTKDHYEATVGFAAAYTAPFAFVGILVILRYTVIFFRWIRWCLTEKPVESKDEFEDV